MGRRGEVLGRFLKFFFGALLILTISQPGVAGFTSDQVQWSGYFGACEQLPYLSSERLFRLTTNQPQRYSLANERFFHEYVDEPTFHSGGLLLDAFFALGIVEKRENSVTEIDDYAFSRTACDCFETGEKWHYVWTRDIGYAAYLALGILSPERSWNSLLFKTSARRGGHGREIVQDTGTGGSWPISTDRVVWSMGAAETLKLLDHPDKLQTSYAAMRQSIERDREAIYNGELGLYSGETSFLDWREQTYPRWMAADTIHVGTSMSLSTNIAHFANLQQAAEYADRLQRPYERSKYQRWANELASAINRVFWDETAGLYRSFLISRQDRVPTRKFELLGNSLAILFAVASPRQAEKIIAAYPVLPAGPPVVWPQEWDVPIYHNRSLWPFVTSFYLLAAKQVGNPAAFDHALQSLVRGAALNMSNMENFEFVTQKPYVSDGYLSGPVVNSRRQLWSVAGALAAVMRGIMGIEFQQEVISFSPFVTRFVRQTLTNNSPNFTLRNLAVRGKTVNVILDFPDLVQGVPPPYTHYRLASIELNGIRLQNPHIKYSALAPVNDIVIKMTAVTAANQQVRILGEAENEQKFYSPRSPVIRSVSLAKQGIVVEVDRVDYSDTLVNLYRNNQLLVSHDAHHVFVDSTHDLNEPACYVAELKYRAVDNYSHHSPLNCYFPPGSIQEIGADDQRFYGIGNASKKFEHGRLHFNNWGYENQALVIDHIRVPKDANYLLEMTYGNAFNSVTTGVTAAVKRMQIYDSRGDLVATGIWAMPHLQSWSSWRESNGIVVGLLANETYRVVMSDYFNMSYLQHFENYRGPGGDQQTINRANISNLKITLQPPN